MLGIDILYSLLNHEENQFGAIGSVLALMRSMLLIYMRMYAFGEWIMILHQFSPPRPVHSNSQKSRNKSNLLFLVQKAHSEKHIKRAHLCKVWI